MSLVCASYFLGFRNWVFLAVIDRTHQIFVLARSKHTAGVVSPGMRVLQPTFVINGLTQKPLIFDGAAFVATISWLGLRRWHLLVHNLRWQYFTVAFRESYMWVNFTVALIIYFNLVLSLAEGVFKIDKVRRRVKVSTEVKGIELAKERRLDAESICWLLHSGAWHGKWVLIKARVSLLAVASNIEVLHHLWMHINWNLPI